MEEFRQWRKRRRLQTVKFAIVAVLVAAVAVVASMRLGSAIKNMVNAPAEYSDDEDRVPARPRAPWG